MAYSFFLVFIIAVLTFGSIGVGPFSFRVYFTIIMLVYLLFQKKTIPNDKQIDRKYMYLFIAFIIYLFIALTLNGGMAVFNYFHTVTALYLVGIIAFFAIDRFVGNYKDIEKLVFVLSLLVFADSFITLLQSQGNNFSWVIGSTFGDETKTSDMMDNREIGLYASFLPGIMGGVVGNGFFLAVCTPLLFTKLIGNRPISVRIYYLAMIGLAVVACFYTQQRAAFFLLFATVVYNLIRAFSSKRALTVILVLFALLLALYLSSINISTVELGRMSSKTNEDRLQLADFALDVILRYPLFGNPVEYYRIAEVSAHNIILDTMIVSGIFGTLIMSVLYFKTLLKSIIMALRNKFIVSEYTRAAAFSVLTAMMLGLVHNTSFFTGAALIFITLALMLKSELIDKFGSRV